MKLNLRVLTTGKTEGKIISVNVPQFLVGRDPQCHLRPASPVISHRHCALLMRENKAYIRDFDSRNGTFVNDVRVNGQKELNDGDELKIGPLAFKVLIEANANAELEPQAASEPDGGDDEAAAALLLSLQDDSTVPRTALDDIPTGSTIMDMPALPADGAASGKTEEGKHAASRGAGGVGDTSAAAGSLLQKYLRRKKK